MMRWKHESYKHWLPLFAIVLIGVAVQTAGAANQAATPKKLFTSTSPAAKQRALPGVSEAMTSGETTIAQTDASALADNDNEMQIDLSPGLSVVVHKQRFETKRDGTSEWYGEVRRERKKVANATREAPVDELNSVVLVKRGNRVGGRVQVQGDVYMIMPSAQGETTVTKIDPSKLPPEAGSSGTDEMEVAEQSAASRLGRALPSAHSTVYAMFVTTPQVRKVVPNMDVLIATGIALFNQANANSHVEMTIENAGILNADYDEIPKRTDSFSDMLNDLRGKGVAGSTDFSRQVAAFRDAHRADEVVMVVANKEMCGYALKGGESPTKDKSFAVVEQSCLASQITLGHEIGHNFGASHDLAQYGGTPKNKPAYAHGIQHIAGKSDSWRTIMAYACTTVTCPKIVAFSNPDINYNGIPTGGAQYEDVARVLNAQRDTIAGFYPPPPGAQPPKAVARANPSEADAGSVVTLDGSASSVTGGGALSYEWMQISGAPALTIDHSDQAVASVAIPPDLQAGTFEFELVVTTKEGLSDSQHVKITTRPVVNLSATITAPDTVYSGQPVPVSATVVNPSGGTVKYVWGKSAQFTGNIGNSPSGTYTAAEVGANTKGAINLKVTVGTSEYTVPNKTVTVLPSQIPTGTISGPASLNAGQEGTFTVTATDPHGGALTYAWTKPSGWGGTVCNTASVKLTAPNVTQNSHATVAVKVTNAVGKALDLSQPVAVTVPVAPITATLAVPSTVVVGGSLPVRVDAKSATGRTLSYTWIRNASNFSGSIGNKPSGTYTALAAGEGKTTNISVEISDGTNKYTTPQQAVTILAASPPTGAISGPTSLNAGEEGTYTVNATDPQGGALTYAWTKPTDWSGMVGNTASVKLTAPNVAQNSHATVAVKVANAVGKTLDLSQPVTIVALLPPTGTINGPANLNAGQQGSFTVNATDPQGGALTYAWTKPSGWSGTVGNTPSVKLTAPNVTQNSHATVAVKVTNAAGKTLDLSQPVAVVALLPPTGTISGPASLTSGEEATFTVNATDPQGGALTYAWTKPSGWSGTVGNTASVKLTAPNVTQNSQATVAVKVTNAVGKALNLSQSVAVTVPVAPITATLTVPSTVTVGGSLPVRVDAKSATGRTLSYTWIRNASNFSGSIGNKPSGTYTALAAGEGKTTNISVEISDGTNKYTTPQQAVTILAAPSSGGTACYEPWSSSKVYGVISSTHSAARVSQSGRNYEQQFWTQGDNPAQANGVGQPWKDLGACK